MGSLVQLVANRGITSNITYLYETLPLTIDGDGKCRKYQIPQRRSDMVQIVGLTLESSLDIDTIWKQINYLTLRNDKSDIIRVNRNILKLISSVEKIDNQYIFKIDFGIFMGGYYNNKYNDFPSVAVQYQPTYILFELNNTDNIDSCNIVLKQSFLDTTERSDLAQKSHEIPIQQIYGYTLHFTERSKLYLNLSFNFVTKGYFIVGDIDNLTSVTLGLNSYKRFEYTRPMLFIVGKRLSTNTLYLPFNNNIDWKKFDMNGHNHSYVGGLNQSAIKDLEILIEFNKPIISLGFYSINWNTYVISNGIGKLQFNLNNHFVDNGITIIDNFKEPLKEL